jgi:hypothetical protein
MAYIGKQPVVGNFVKLDTITATATTTFNLLNGGVAYFPQSANNCLVSLNGILQAPTDSYTISGSTIIFSSALTISDVIDFIIVLGDVLNIGTPSDGTVSFAKVTSNLITGATAETSIAGGDSVLIYDDSAAALRKMTRTNFVSGIGGTNTPSFFATNSSNQSISHGATTKISFQTERFDTNSAYDNSTNYRFTVPSDQAGKYVISYNLNFNQSTDEYQRGFLSYIYKNGAVLIRNYQFYGLDGGTYFKNIASGASCVLDLSVGDYIEIFAFQNNASGTAGNIMDYDDGTFFCGYKLL